MTAKKDDKAPEVETKAQKAEANEAPAKRTWPGSDEISLYADMLKLSAADLAEAIKADADNPIPEEKVAGLLKLERSGQNRTDHVRALCDRLGVKSPLEVTKAGPAYTNDTTAITEI